MDKKIFWASKKKISNGHKIAFTDKNKINITKKVTTKNLNLKNTATKVKIIDLKNQSCKNFDFGRYKKMARYKMDGEQKI